MIVKPITAKRLENIATSYMERYASSAGRLREVLLRRVRKARHAEAPVVDDAEAVIEGIVGRYVKAGILDDRRFAEHKAGALSRRGTSQRRIREKLVLARVGREDVDHALSRLRDAAGGDGELAAAVALARRRRLGPFADPAVRRDRRDKHLAAMGRAGFALGLARRVIDAKDADELLE
ncbi:MAG: RecX family transcriptional regulator [Reyranellaceae bacterium]